jgi:hypothetical protein
MNASLKICIQPVLNNSIGSDLVSVWQLSSAASVRIVCSVLLSMCTEPGCVLIVVILLMGAAGSVGSMYNLLEVRLATKMMEDCCGECCVYSDFHYKDHVRCSGEF